MGRPAGETVVTGELNNWLLCVGEMFLMFWTPEMFPWGLLGDSVHYSEGSSIRGPSCGGLEDDLITSKVVQPSVVHIFNPNLWEAEADESV